MQLEKTTSHDLEGEISGAKNSISTNESYHMFLSSQLITMQIYNYVCRTKKKGGYK